MFTITINDKKKLKTDLKISDTAFEGNIDGKKSEGNWSLINPHQLHILHNNKSYNVDVIKVSKEEKTAVLKINSKKFSLKIEDEFDALLHQLGMDSSSTKKVSDIKAPMPGMVLNILVKEGDAVKKGDSVLVLEAMKMENIIKSSGEGIIKKINAQKGKAVEKNQVLIQF